jgi:hypothetical protein
MFDVLGFKALREEKGTSGLHQQYLRGILPAIQHSAAGKSKIVESNGQKVLVPDFTPSSLGYSIFSDTVIFFSENDSFESFCKIVNSSFSLLQLGFAGGKSPFRGAIGCGDLINDPRGILLGSGIEDAYIGESSQAWAGAMLTPSCRELSEREGYIEKYKARHLEIGAQMEEEIKRTSAIENSKRLVLYDVPIQKNPKDGPAIYETARTYAIDWTIRMYEGASDQSFASSTSSHAQTIAANTKAFETWARQCNR